MPQKLDQTSKSVNALLNLLTAAGLDTVDSSLIDREADRCQLDIRTDLLPADPQAWDRQVEKLIRQLKDAVRDTPERDVIMNDSGSKHQHTSNANMYADGDHQPKYETENQAAPEDDRRQYLEREFSSTSYPKIGPGYSDSISVVSDLTIPTVVAGMAPEEEKYEGPPMQIGFERKTSSSRQQLRRPSLERNRREAANELRPPSRREISRPGGAAANRRQSHQMTMAHLSGGQPLTSSNSPLASAVNPLTKAGKPRTSITMTVNDFPSLKEVSGAKELDTFGSSRRSSGSRHGERRSLLGKSNKYAASVSATASQRMLLARQQSAKVESNSRRRRSTATPEGSFGFQSLASSTKSDDASSKKSVDPLLIDADGFIIGDNQQQRDPFAAVAPAPSFAASFGTESFPSTTPFFPAPAKDTKKKKGGTNRRGSSTSTNGGSLPKAARLDAVEQATKKKLEVLRRQAEGDAAFGSRVDAVEQETMKHIRRIRETANREHYK